MTLPPQCFSCKHFHKAAKRAECDAFDSIPALIIEGLYDHREPMAGDKGITYDPTAEAPEGLKGPLTDAIRKANKTAEKRNPLSLS